MNKAHRPFETRLSAEAKFRIAEQDRGALFLADWMKTVFIHLEVDPVALQAHVPFPLDLYEGRAFVSLVAFTLNGLRPRGLGWPGRLLMRPASDHRFLNLRTYVRQGSETGIYFLAEWLDNRFVIPFGPRTFGLPYRHGSLDYQHEISTGRVAGNVETRRGTEALSYSGAVADDGVLRSVEPNTLDEFLLERYTAFTHHEGRNRFFRIWHRPWPQCRLKIALTRNDLLKKNWPFFRDARYIGANYSPGVQDVWMGFPHRIPAPEKHHRLNTFLQMP